jgi:hypothetical protein
MIILFSIILVCSIISISLCLQSYIYDDNFKIFILNVIIGIVSFVGIILIINSTHNKESKITDKSTNTKDSLIIKDSLLILNMNDTVRVFNINKL